MRIHYSLAIVSLFCVTQTSFADFIDVINPSFEDISGETPFNEFTFGPLNGWQLYDPNSITNGGAGGTFFVGTLRPNAPTFFTNGAPDGQRVGIALEKYISSGVCLPLNAEWGRWECAGASARGF